MEVALWIAVCVFAIAGWVLLSLYVYCRGEAARWNAVANRLLDAKCSPAVPSPSDPPPAASDSEPSEPPERWPL